MKLLGVTKSTIERNGRPPHGGRGLKYNSVIHKDGQKAVAPHTGGVD